MSPSDAMELVLTFKRINIEAGGYKRYFVPRQIDFGGAPPHGPMSPRGQDQVRWHQRYQRKCHPCAAAITMDWDFCST